MRAGLFLEDQVWPKRCGHMAGKQVVERGEWLAKLRSALDRRTHLHITARTDARARSASTRRSNGRARPSTSGSTPSSSRRPSRSPSSSASPPSLPGVTLVANMVETGRTPLLTPTELHELGFHLIVSPLSGVFAMARGRAARRSSGWTRPARLRDDLDRLVAFDEFTDIVELERPGHGRPDRRRRPGRPLDGRVRPGRPL